MIKKEDVFKIGRFAKPHGVKGELSLVTTSDLFDEVDEPYIVCDMDGILVPFFIEEYRYKSDTVTLVKLECVDNEDAAREFVNRDVYYPLEGVEEENLVGDMTWDSFIGYTVTDSVHGLLGPIKGVDESTINVLLQVDYKGEELLFPAVEELITEVDHTRKQMTVSLPEGLLDL
ncbi:16S rRNA processing protein RimM [Parabacteroides sp. 52]|uniref:ribosome maturation factor RimM n=1 Tax=unclassified Parabacteroides TaxID=2649774 RepID=UPI0013D2B154|nr:MULTISPECIES: ribosome maturation factor RimM [unclassified Parabacteroides]MDH6533961.1 16S rRNA processing protein RimM [Parabacteroides sp. PM5-20]NDV54704.1 16S rRNA processing protein RimM [Parabacteroides sp. 52]